MSGGGGSQTTTTTQELAPEQQELLNMVIPVAEQQINNPPELFPGSSIAPFNPLQQQGQQMAVGSALDFIQPLAQSTSQGAQAVQDFAVPASLGGLGSLVGGLGRAQPSQDFLMSGALLNPETNPALQGQIEAAIRPLAQSMQTDILPQIRGGAVDAGQFGSSRQGIAEGLAARDFMQQAGDISTNIVGQNFTQGLDAMTRAVSDAIGAGAMGTQTGLEQGTRALFAAPTLADLALRPASVVESVGNLQRQLEQAQLTEESDRFLADQMIPFLVAQDVANLAFGAPSGTSSVTQGGGGGGGILDILGVLGPFAMAGATAFSDRRLKTAIVRIGETLEGYSKYLFRYIWDRPGVERIGVMADEVPENLVFEIGGVKFVDYSRITL